jgi:hypothetical protein
MAKLVFTKEGLDFFVPRESGRTTSKGKKGYRNVKALTKNVFERRQLLKEFFR